MDKTILEEVGKEIGTQLATKANIDMSNVEELPQHIVEKLKGANGKDGVSGVTYDANTETLTFNTGDK